MRPGGASRRHSTAVGRSGPLPAPRCGRASARSRAPWHRPVDEGRGGRGRRRRGGAHAADLPRAASVRPPPSSRARDVNAVSRAVVFVLVVLAVGAGVAVAMATGGAGPAKAPATAADLAGEPATAAA